MGLDGKADSHAEDAGRHKPIPEEAPDCHHAQAYDDSRGIATRKENFTVGKHDANQEERDGWSKAPANIPHQESGKEKHSGEENQPNHQRGSVRQKREGSDEEISGR